MVAAGAMACALAPVGAHALRVRLVNETQLVLEPSLAPSGTEIRVRARATSGGARLANRSVVLRADGAPLAPVRTGSNGEASFVVPLNGASEVRLTADLEAGQDTAPAHAEAQYDPARRYSVSLRLDAPSTVELSGPAVSVTVGVGVSGASEMASGFEVQLRLDDQPLGTAQTDASEQARFTLDPARIAGPGMHTLVAVHERAGTRVARSPEHPFAARARTALRVAAVTEREGSYEINGALASSAGPVAEAPVRLYVGERALLAALTDRRGDFVFRVSAEAAAGVPADAVVQARFEPGEPWFTPARSEGLRLPRPVPVAVRWTWAVAVAAAAALFFAASRWLAQRAHLAALRAKEQTAGGSKKAGRPRSVAPPVAGDRSVRLQLEPVDRATGLAVEGARARWIAPAIDERPAAEPVVVRGGLVCSVEVRAPGFAPVVARVEAPLAAGTHVRPVELTPWREALFERARGWLAKSGPARTKRAALPTLREALGAAPSGVARALVEQVERGAYGPEEPDEASVASIGGLIDQVGAAETAANKRPRAQVIQVSAPPSTER